MMITLLKVIIYLMIVCLSSTSVARSKGEPVNHDCDTPLKQMGYLGSSVTINCTYPREQNNKVKLFCREDKNSNCTNVISTQMSNFGHDRFALTHNKEQGAYTVTISQLTQTDTGRYWCAVKTESSRIACLTKIDLHILSWDNITPNQKTPGKNAKFMCNYPHRHENNTKYLCKGVSPFNCVELIQTTETERDVTKGKLVIRDNKRRKYFYVYINNLTTDDSGIYWCGSDREWLHADIPKTHLIVAERHIENKKSDHSTQPTAVTPSTTNLHDGHSNFGLIVPVVVCLGMIVIVVIVIAGTRACCASGGSSEQSIKDGRNIEENHGGHDYEEIQEWNQEVSSGGAVSSVYAMLSLPTDQLHYASVNFQTD